MKKRTSKLQETDKDGWLTTRKPRTFNPAPLVVYDIETWGLTPHKDAFAIGVVIDRWGTHKFWEREAIRDYLVQPKLYGCKIYAHNGGRYDHLCLFGKLQHREYFDKVLYSKGRFISAERTYDKQKQKKGITLYDSYNVLPRKLKEIGKHLGMPKGELPTKFEKGIRQPIEDSDFDYCVQDCRILYTGLTQFFTQIGRFTPTIGSASMYLFRSRYLPHGFHWNTRYDVMWWDAYYGARNELYYMGKLDEGSPQYCYDVNGMYGYVMATQKYPDPTSLRYEKSNSVDMLLERLEDNRYEGAARCTVEHKPVEYVDGIPYLPYPKEDQLTFPTGTFSGTWTFPELRKAIADDMIRVRKVDWIMTAHSIQSPFRKFIEDIQNKLEEYEEAGDKFGREIQKLLRNSGYGKWAERREYQTEYAKDFDREYFNTLGKGWEWRPINMLENDGYYYRENTRLEALSSHTIFSWASYITAYARLTNLEWQLRIKNMGGTVYYTDNDSFVCDVLLPTGKGIGELKLEPKRFLRINTLKDYQFLNLETGHVERKLRGVPDNAPEVAEDTYHITGYHSEMASIRLHRDVGEVKEYDMKLSRKYKKATRLDGGQMKPFHLS